MAGPRGERSSLSRVLENRRCCAFACACVLLLVSSSLVGLGMMAKGENVTDLVADDRNNWRVKDVIGLDGATQTWDYWKPVQTASGLEVAFNDASSVHYTVYVHNLWVGDLTGMKIRAVFEIRADTSVPPIWVARLDDTKVQVKLNFQTTAGYWAPEDLWWSTAEVVLTKYNKVGDEYQPVADISMLNTPLILEVPMVPDKWVYHSGAAWDNATTLEWFYDAIADVQEIGFSFGRGGSLAGGVALTQGDATFVLKGYEILPINCVG